MHGKIAHCVDVAQLHRALVIKLRHHGDVLLSAPVFSTLKRVAPHCEVDALVYAETAPMLVDHPAITQVLTIDRAWKSRGLAAQGAAEWRLLNTLRARHYDLLVHLTEHPRGAWLCRLLKPRWAVAPQRSGRLWSGSFTHLTPPAPAHRHTVESNLDALRRIGLPVTDADKRVCLVPGAAAEARAHELLSRHGLHDRAFIHLHPTSRWMFKAWTVESYARLIAALQERGFPVVVTAAPVPNEMAMSAAIMAHCQTPPIDLTGQLTLKELGAAIAKARLFVGGDSMPMHIAAAMGTPTVALFGPSDDSLWGPWRTPHRIVASDRHPCRPCGLDGCGGGKISECLSTLPVDRVLTACEELLA
jgi:heptosyltransferase-3